MKNTFFLAIIFAIQILAISGCSSLGDMKGGFFPKESYNEYKARLAEEEVRRKTTFEEVSSQTPNNSSIEHRPNRGLNYSSGFGPGVEVDNYGDTTTVITPRLWGKSKSYNEGLRREKQRDNEWRFREEEDLARRRGREDAQRGGPDLQGVSLKFVQAYYDEFDWEKRSLDRQAHHDRAWREYRQGQADYRDGVTGDTTEITASTRPGPVMAETVQHYETAAVPAPGVSESTQATSELPDEEGAQTDSPAERLVSGSERDVGTSLVEPTRADDIGQESGETTPSPASLSEEQQKSPGDVPSGQFADTDERTADSARELPSGQPVSTSTEEAEAPLQREEVVSPALGYGVVEESTSLVATPSVMADSEGVVPRGATVELLDEQPKYYKVRWNGREGFLYNIFIRRLPGD